jgi:hypothetical protein
MRSQRRPQVNIAGEMHGTRSRGAIIEAATRGNGHGKAIRRRLRRLEESHLAQKNEHGLTPVDVLRQRRCRRLAKEMGRSYEALLREKVKASQAFWASYEGDRSIAGVLRYRRALAHATPGRSN